MFFAIIGIGIFCYGVLYTITLCLLDCDLQLAFYEKFGKSVRKYTVFNLFVVSLDT